ncbi:MAG: flagellar basal body protein, partial [Rhodospirillales bacterium]|nr:flagellar basal body protein [Rhodospirillales bacterium]
MAGSLTLALRSAQSGLLVNQQALDAIANNVANVNSPGYSRKVVNVQQRVVGGTGAGVELSEITRVVDEGLIKSFRLEAGVFEELDIQRSYYERLQDLFGTPENNTSVSHVLESFGEALEALALSPN